MNHWRSLLPWMAITMGTGLVAEVSWRILAPLNFTLQPEAFPAAIALGLLHGPLALALLIWPAHEVLRREASGERAWRQGQGHTPAAQLLAIYGRSLLVLGLATATALGWLALHGASIPWGEVSPLLARAASIAAASLLFVQIIPRLGLVLAIGLLWLLVAHLPASLASQFLLPARGLLGLFPPLAEPSALTWAYALAYGLLAQALAERRHPAP